MNVTPSQPEPVAPRPKKQSSWELLSHLLYFSLVNVIISSLFAYLWAIWTFKGVDPGFGVLFPYIFPVGAIIVTIKIIIKIFSGPIYDDYASEELLWVRSFWKSSLGTIVFSLITFVLLTILFKLVWGW